MPSTDAPLTRKPVLVSIGGLPATGKATVAGSLAGQLGAAYVRIDTIETAIGRAEGRFQQTNDWRLAPGYEVGYDVAVDQLRNGLDVASLAACASPWPPSTSTDDRMPPART